MSRADLTTKSELSLHYTVWLILGYLMSSLHMVSCN